MPDVNPRFPVFVPSKGRPKTATAPKFLSEDDVPFTVVVEPQEYDEYARHWPEEVLHEMPGDVAGVGLATTRNYVMDLAQERGADRHWQLDDNLRSMRVLYDGLRIPAHSGVALRLIEDLTLLHDNVGLSGPNYMKFVIPSNEKVEPFRVNVHVYSCLLINHEPGIRFEVDMNEDTDLCLQMLANGWATIQTQFVMCHKPNTTQNDRSQRMDGGNTSNYAGLGRARFAKVLENRWPGVVETVTRYGRAHHHIKGSWGRFDADPQLKDGVTEDDFPSLADYGLVPKKQSESVANSRVREMIEEKQEADP